VGLRDYYRQFDGLSEGEVNAGLRERAQERRMRALARVEPLDLSRTTWPHLPHSDVVNAVTYVARRGLHQYRDRDAGQLHSELAHHHGVARERVVVGNGAAELLRSAAQALLEPGDELITPWPSYALLPLMARRARARAVAVDDFSVDAVLEAINQATRVVALANPNDPTGERLSSDELRGLSERLPERVVLLLDEALGDYVDSEPVDATVALLDDHPRTLVFRSFSKAWGLAGLRCGYVLGGPGSEPLLARLEPELGVNDLAQAGALEALRSGRGIVGARTAQVATERQRLTFELRRRGVVVGDSQANFLWIRHPGTSGTDLAQGLGAMGVIVAPGSALGDPARVRVAIHDQVTGDRLLRSIDGALAAISEDV